MANRCYPKQLKHHGRSGVLVVDWVERPESSDRLYIGPFKLLPESTKVKLQYTQNAGDAENRENASGAETAQNTARTPDTQNTASAANT
ncbi:hypothetical protein [Trichocoleus sp. FACHB-262]|uniref:hypothetical protein n=1 Tax=Trichocoleus sp. FACHB-262 TaxID=2692869 RepID=UPI001689A73D|nr:hypothetical protein [Trichocoleus sp. FACHB-262]MBD2123335.1 hypothetical protein [Trichocoleus sp. FACHB-262]